MIFLADRGQGREKDEPFAKRRTAVCVSSSEASEPVDEGPRKHEREAYGREIEAKTMRAESE